jgi:tetratricopeptide (TPR) repeat protein
MTGTFDLRFGLALVLCAMLSGPAVTASTQGATNTPCPSGAIAVMPGSSIQTAVDQAGPNAAFCLKNGMHRVQVVRPLDGQSFYGEGGTILNGSRLLTQFGREGSYWVAGGQTQHGQRHGECMSTAPACDLPEAVFIDDQPLNQVLTKDEVKPGSFYFDYAGDRIYLADDPTGHKVEATVGAFAFRSLASNVLIENLIIEKYASPAQSGMQSELETAKQAADRAKAQATELAKRVASLNSELEEANAQRNELQAKLDQANLEIKSAQAPLELEKANAQPNMGDPENACWHRDIVAANVYVGDMLMAQGDPVRALKWYRDSLAVADRLAKSSPENAGMQRDLSISYNKIGDALAAGGNLTEALKTYQESLAIRDRLAKADSNKTDRQRDLAISQGRVAVVLAEQGDASRALDLLQQGRVIIARLKEQSPDNNQLSKDLAEFDADIAKLKQANISETVSVKP